MSQDTFEQIPSFLSQIIAEITEVGIDVSQLQIDHIAYSTKTTVEYEQILPIFLAQGTLEKEAIIGNRRVAVIKLTTPINYNSHQISAVELIEPKVGQDALSGWEHVEFLVTDYQDLLAAYPNLDWDTTHMQRESFSRVKLTLPSQREVKFLDTPVLQSIVEDK